MHHTRYIPSFVLVILLSGQYLCCAGRQTCWDDNKKSHTIKPLSPRVLRKQLCRTSGNNFRTLLNPLLTPRVPDTEGGRKAARYITNKLENLGWTVEKISSTQNTIIGTKTFTNLVATFNPDSPRRLVLAAHYDTKIQPDGFIGAVDSAVPCAMMIDLANKTMNFLKRRSRKKTPEITLQLIFFDGEEAFRQWTDTDSLYGSRDLAAKWNKQSYQVDPSLGFCQSNPATYLDRIDAFVLLDLIGAKNPVFRKYRNYDLKLFEGLEVIEGGLRLVSGSCDVPSVLDTNPQSGFIQDDHIPFYNLGMRNILHLIASPFPTQWHTLEDNKANLDFPTIDYIEDLMEGYIYQYLQ